MYQFIKANAVLLISAPLKESSTMYQAFIEKELRANGVNTAKMSPKDNSNKTGDGNKKHNKLKKKKTEQDKKKKVVTLEEAMKTVRVIDNKKQFYS